VSSLGLLLLLTSCGGKPDKSEVFADSLKASDTGNIIQANAVLPEDSPSILGYYVGDFIGERSEDAVNPSYTNKITLAIDSLVGDRLFGHTVVAGNNTPFQGTYSVESRIYRVAAAEPSTEKYGGEFRFEIDSAHRISRGEWAAYNQKLPVAKRGFTLEKRTFRYDPDRMLGERVLSYPLTAVQEEDRGEEWESMTEDVLKINASTDPLKKEQVENLKRGDIEVIRNTIYARHGYSFQNRKMRYLFDRVDWYMPVSTDIRANLTELENKNIDLLKRYEEHAKRYYDYFGR
jgi:hypothetical protein